MISRHQAHRRSALPALLGRALALMATGGLGYFAAHAIAAGIARPDYLLFLFGLLFLTLAGIALNLGLRR